MVAPEAAAAFQPHCSAPGDSRKASSSNGCIQFDFWKPTLVSLGFVCVCVCVCVCVFVRVWGVGDHVTASRSNLGTI